MIYKLFYNLIKYALLSAFVLSALGWAWFNFMIGLSVLRGVFSLIFGG